MDDDGDIDKYGNLFPENVYKRLFKIFDSDPETFMSSTLKDLSLDSTEKVYNLISFNLKKDNFVDNLPHILFEDFFEHSNNVFTIDMSLYDDRIQKRLDVRKIDDFLELVTWNGLYVYDAHDNIRLNFEDYLTDEDYLYMQEELIEIIEYNEGIN